MLMNNILIDKFGPRLKGIAALLGQFQENLYYIYDSKNQVPGFKASTDQILKVLIGSSDDREDAVFENLEKDIISVQAYFDEWQPLLENEIYHSTLFLMKNLLQEMKALIVAWNTQSEAEKREVLSTVRRQSRLQP